MVGDLSRIKKREDPYGGNSFGKKGGVRTLPVGGRGEAFLGNSTSFIKKKAGSSLFGQGGAPHSPVLKRGGGGVLSYKKERREEAKRPAPLSPPPRNGLPKGQPPALG